MGLPNFLYLAVDFGCILLPFIFSFYHKTEFRKDWKYFWPACLSTALVFVIWDVIFTKNGVWSFNQKYVSGIDIFNLPLEEILFFICIPYACVFTYFVLKKYINLSSGLLRFLRLLLYTVAIFISIIAFFNLTKWYTCVTFLATAAAILWFLSKFNSEAGFLALTYVVLLIPFFISNGILTGAITAEPVVIYNNNHNLGIRMVTIPVEDTMYGFLLFIGNVAGMEWLKRRSGKP